MDKVSCLTCSVGLIHCSHAPVSCVFFRRYTVQFSDDVREQKRGSGVGFQNDRVQLLEELVRGRFIRRPAVRPVVRIGRLQWRCEYISSCVFRNSCCCYNDGRMVGNGGG